MEASDIKGTTPTPDRHEIPAKIGPNSLIQTVRALEEIYGNGDCCEILLRAGQSHLLSESPGHMVNEQEFISLAQRLFDQLGLQSTKKVLKRSGQLTADYLLANRIPKPIQILFKFMPRSLRLRFLLTAIGKNAWTFAGSGTYSFLLGKAPVIVLTNCIIGKLQIAADEPICTFYSGTFEKLLQVMVDPVITVQEQECLAIGSNCCTFSIRL